MPSKLEPRGLCEDNKKPDGHTTFTWKDGKNLAWDWTTSCTVSPSNLSISLKGPGETAASKEKAKCKKYAELMDTFHFVPIASETFGAWGPKTRGFLTDLGKQVIAYTLTRGPSSSCSKNWECAFREEMLRPSFLPFPNTKSWKRSSSCKQIYVLL